MGEKVGRAVVDLYGDKVMAAPLHGDTWRIRHDTVKAEINRLCVWSKLPATCEVFGLFSYLIPQAELSRIEKVRKRHEKEWFQVPCPTGGRVSRLAELKVINCCQTRYLPGAGPKAVDRRAKLLQGEYLRKAREADTQYLGIAKGQVGPVENNLLQYGDINGLVVECLCIWGGFRGSTLPCADHS